MKNLKQRLIDETKKGLVRMKAEIKQSDEELEILDARLKIEKKFYEVKDIEKDLKEDIKYSVAALEDMIAMELDRNAELKKDAKISAYRLTMIEKFADDEL